MDKKTVPFNLTLKQKLRNNGIDVANKKIRITKYESSKQLKDITMPTNCGGFGRIHHFRRIVDVNWPVNPLPIEPACAALNIIPSDQLVVQLFQNAICSWRCWYCFIDECLLRGDPKHSEFISADELLELYLSGKGEVDVIDISGGQPELTPEWTLWMMESLIGKNMNENIYLWNDDSLSNDFLWRYLSREQIKYMTRFKNYGRVGCFKGFDEYSFSFNTNIPAPFFNFQFQIMKRLIKEGFDVYGYVTLTTDRKENLKNNIVSFIDKIQLEIHPDFPLKMVPLKIFKFSPTELRIKQSHEKALKLQYEAVTIWEEEIKKRFTKDQIGMPIYKHKLA